MENDWLDFIYLYYFIMHSEYNMLRDGYDEAMQKNKIKFMMANE